MSESTSGGWSEKGRVVLRKKPKIAKSESSKSLLANTKIKIPLTRSASTKIPRKYPEQWVTIDLAKVPDLFKGKNTKLCYFRARYSFTTSAGSICHIRPCILYDVVDGKCKFKTNKPISIAISKLIKLEVDRLHLAWMKLKNWRSKRELRISSQSKK